METGNINYLNPQPYRVMTVLQNQLFPIEVGKHEMQLKRGKYIDYIRLVVSSYLFTMRETFFLWFHILHDVKLRGQTI